MENGQPKVAVQIMVPARNEEQSLGRCLESLTGQQGVDFQITVIDDGSTDRTHAIAESFPGVRVMVVPEPAPGVTGKCNALIHGARGTTARWLLFTDADTFHYPGSLAAAVREAEKRGADLLSYSPEQEVVSWSERALMPVVFADLVRQYPPDQVNDPADPTVAANGQYMLVRRTVYNALGGHQSVANKILEDVELARIFKTSRHKIWFRHGAGLVRTRMYRDFNSMREGWTKNLALLFPSPLTLAMARGLEFVAIAGLFALSLAAAINAEYLAALGPLAASATLYAFFMNRIARAHLPWTANIMSFLGLPLFVWFLARSWRHARARGAVTWKGRTYAHFETGPPVKASTNGDSELES